MSAPGIGPTLEFYSLVAAELQRKDKGMWICDDEEELLVEDVDLGQGPKRPGYYVKAGPAGLFPAPYPQDSTRLPRICALFHFLGIFVGKSLQDQRLVDIPLSLAFFKMMCKGSYGSSSSSTGDMSDSSSDCEDSSEALLLLKSESLSSLTESEAARYRCDSDAASDISSAQGSSCLENQEAELAGGRKLGGGAGGAPLTIEDIAPLLQEDADRRAVCQTAAADRRQTPDRQQSPWFAGLLNSADFAATNPYLAKFLASLDRLAEKKRAILSDQELSESERWEAIESLTLPSSSTDTGGARVEDLCLDFQFSPASKIHGYSSHELKPGGENIPVTMRNIEEYSDLTRSFCLDTGIRKQMEAFKAGFTEVFPLSHLKMFTPQEIRLLLCGEMSPDWSRQDLLDFTEPKFGYNKDSSGFLDLVEVLVEMSPGERKSFLQFATGCSSLPPGGLANLHPRLTVVKKEGGEGDTALPSVNTCVHYLKLPEYSSKEVLRAKLLQSTQEKGFHLN